jgi:hypothetical protein
MENRSPVVSVGKTMLDPTVDPDDSIDVRNPDAKRENQKSMRYLRGTISTLKQHHKKNDYRWILATIVESMDAVSSTIFDGGQAIRQNTSSSIIKLVTRFF